MEIERPLDLLNNLRSKKVVVRLDEKEIEGKLIAFDIHINLVVEVNGYLEFIRGDRVTTIKAK